MAAEALPQLLEAIESLPASVNPYHWSLHFLQDTVSPPMPSFFFVQSYVAAGLASLGIVCTVATLMVKIRTDSVWLFRKRSTKSGTLLPNASMVLLIFTSLYFVINLVSLPFALQSYKWRHNPIGYQSMQSVMWLPILLCIHAACHSQVASLYLTLTNSNAQSRMVNFVSRLLPSWFRAALFINVTYLSGYLTITGASVPLFSLAARGQANAWSAFQDLVETVRPASEAWTPGTPFQLDPAMIPHVLQKLTEGTKSAVYVGRGFLTYTVFQWASVLIYLPATLIYIKLLAAQMRLQREATANMVSSDLTNEETRSIVPTYRLMVLEAVIVLTFEVVFTTISCWLALRPVEVLSNSSLTCALIGVVLFSFGLSSTALSVVFLLRAVQPLRVASRIRKSRKHAKSSSGLISAIAVEIVTQRFTEGLSANDPATPLPTYRASIQFKGLPPTPQTASFVNIRLEPRRPCDNKMYMQEDEDLKY